MIRGCWLALLKSCADDSDDSSFYSNSSAWLGHVAVLLQGSNFVFWASWFLKPRFKVRSKFLRPSKKGLLV